VLQQKMYDKKRRELIARLIVAQQSHSLAADEI
jgi:hypothetical protein